MVMQHSYVVFWQRSAQQINLCAVCVSLVHVIIGSAECGCGNLCRCNKTGCSKIVHMDLNLRCLADSNQLQISMSVMRVAAIPRWCCIRYSY
jgi:hypothetical protein